MNRVLSGIGLATYVLLAAFALLWWAPHFFAVNTTIWPRLDYRYIAATGIPFALLLMTVAARQSFLPRFSLTMALLAVMAGLVGLLAVLSFEFLPQAVFFSALHLGICALGVLWNLNAYRREIKAWDRRQAALRA